MTREQQIAAIPRVTEIYGVEVAEKFTKQSPENANAYLEAVLDGIRVYKAWDKKY